MKYIAILIGTILPHLSMAQEFSLQEISTVLSDMNEIVIKIDAGDELPMDFSLGGDIISLKQKPENGVITALQPLYIKIEPQFLFSSDKNEWLPFETFFTGNLGVSLSSSDERLNPWGEISFDIEKR